MADDWGSNPGSPRRGHRPINARWIAACCLTYELPWQPSTRTTSAITSIMRVCDSSHLTHEPSAPSDPQQARRKPLRSQRGSKDFQFTQRQNGWPAGSRYTRKVSPGCTLVFGRAELQYRGLAGVEIVHDHVDVHLLRYVLVRPGRRGVVRHLLERDALAVPRGCRPSHRRSRPSSPAGRRRTSRAGSGPGSPERCWGSER